MAERKSHAEIDDFVTNLKKTRSGVYVTEADDKVMVRTAEGSTYEFEVEPGSERPAPKPKAKPQTAKPKAKAR